MSAGKLILTFIGRMRWAGHMARVGEERGCIGSCWGTRGKEIAGET